MQNYNAHQHLKQAFAMVADDPELFRWATVRVSESVEPENRREISR